LNTRQQALIADLLQHEDLQERLAVIVERGHRVPHLPLIERSPERRVPGCASSVWLVAKMNGGFAEFRTDADSPVVRGLVFFVADFFNGSTRTEILLETADPLELVNLKRGLSPTRRHGLDAVVAAIRKFAAENPGAPAREVRT
jgi:cysteine desulfuration protein SufE